MHELGRLPLYVYHKIRILNYLIKILKNKDSLMYKIYVMLRNNTNNGRNDNGCNWEFNIKSILDELGCTDIWLYQDTITI